MRTSNNTWLGWTMTGVGASLALLAAVVSVKGLTTLYSGAASFVLILGAALEAAKLSAAAALHMQWREFNKLLRAFLLSVVIAISCITSLGLFSLLAHGYGTHVAEQAELAAQLYSKEDELKRTSTRRTAFIERRQQLDTAINILLDYDRATKATSIQEQQEPERISITTQLRSIDDQIDTLTTEIAHIRASMSASNSKHAALTELTYLFEVDDEGATVRFLSLVLVAITDPVAIILLVVGLGFLSQRDQILREEVSTTGGQTLQARDLLSSAMESAVNVERLAPTTDDIPPHLDNPSPQDSNAEKNVCEDKRPIDSLLPRIVIDMEQNDSLFIAPDGARYLRAPANTIRKWLKSNAPDRLDQLDVVLSKLDPKPPRSMTISGTKLRAIRLPPSKPFLEPVKTGATI